MSRFFVLLRFAGAGALACTLIFFGGGLLVSHFAGHHPDQTVGLTVIRGIKLLSHVPGQGSSARPEASNQQTLRGFVQLGFIVGPDGKAHHIRVIAAEPPGQSAQVEAAREIIALRHYKPVPSGSKKSGVQRSEVVHFQVPTSVLTGSAKNAQGGGSD